MIWQNPELLWLLLVIPCIVAITWYKRKRLKKRREEFFSEDLFKNLRIGYWANAVKLRNGLIVFGLFFVIVAAAGPKIGTEVREIKRRGIDMMIALDLSASMNAEDVRPSRLDKAKYEINRLINRLNGDRIGLIVFTGEAYLQIPMTLDYSALRLFLDIADTNQMPSSSTDFSSAMETALKAFESAEENSSTAAKVLLIVSDGENHGGSYDAALSELVDNSISVYTLGIGTRMGATIPLYGDNGSLLGYKRNNRGQVITTNLQDEVLREIATKSNGTYYEIQKGNDGIDGFLARVDELEKGEFSSQEYADFKNQYQWVAAFGLICIIVSLLIPAHRNTK